MESPCVLPNAVIFDINYIHVYYSIRTHKKSTDRDFLNFVLLKIYFTQEASFVYF